jgi:hypothetical protein
MWIRWPRYGFERVTSGNAGGATVVDASYLPPISGERSPNAGCGAPSSTMGLLVDDLRVECRAAGRENMDG